LGEGELGPQKHNVARDEAYLHAKFHLDLSKCVATVHTNVTDRTDRTDRQRDNGLIAYRADLFTNGRPKRTGPTFYIICIRLCINWLLFGLS